MSVFTKRRKEDLRSLNTVSVKLDSKGRISIPSFLRKNLDIKIGECLDLVFDLRKNFLVIVQNGVADSIEVCGSTSFFRKERPTLERNYNTKKQITSGVGSTPASGPLKLKRRDYESTIS